jgi:predicted ArsR family transcriptional regulator
MKLNDAQAAEYFRRSYTAVDGLWFVKTEEDGGFERALEIDRRVWEVLPKIQARMMKAWASAEDGAEGLVECLSARYALEGYDAAVEQGSEGEVSVCIKTCPWLEKMKKSGREHLASKVSQVICPTEHSAWAAEFGMTPEVDIPRSMCEGAGSCGFLFKPR